MKYFYIFILLFICSCSSKEPSSLNNSTHIPLPPDDLIEKNIKNTDITVAFEIINNEIIEKRGIYYAVYNAKAKVIKNYIGNDLQAGNIFTYSGDGEYKILKKYLKNQIGKKYIASFKKNDNNYYYPDVGYEFGYSDELDKKVKLIIKNLTNQSSGSK